jgi:hypothetical protein
MLKRTMTHDESRLWIANPSINPMTGRRIKVNSATYQLLNKQCEALGLQAFASDSCSNKWIVLSSDEALEYDKTNIVACYDCGGHSKLQFIHAVDETDLTDYQCDRCGRDGNIRYFCISCRNSRNA